MSGPRVIDPDAWLETDSGRVFTAERNAEAWEQAYRELEAALARATPATRLYLVMGVQAAGKSTWIREQAGQIGDAAICLDAALPARRHRERALALAARFGVAAIAVRVRAPLEEALRRNRLRRQDHQVPEDAIRSVHSLLEPPVKDEGFAAVHEVEAPPPTPDAGNPAPVG